MIFLILALTTSAWAGVVRDLEMNDSKAEAVYLCLGRSTVLRFREPPQKIVAGNKNYFHFEFLGHDVAIQPRREVESNLFVYGEYNRYTFNLKFLSGCRYDDLVKVFPSKSQKKGVQRAILEVGNTLKMAINPPALLAGGHHLWVIDFFLSYHGRDVLDVRQLELKLNGKTQKFVTEKDFLKSQEAMRGRIFFNGKNNGLLNFTVKLKGERANASLSWRTP